MSETHLTSNEFLLMINSRIKYHLFIYCSFSKDFIEYTIIYLFVINSSSTDFCMKVKKTTRIFLCAAI